MEQHIFDSSKHLRFLEDQKTHVNFKSNAVETYLSTMFSNFDDFGAQKTHTVYGPNPPPPPKKSKIQVKEFTFFGCLGGAKNKNSQNKLKNVLLFSQKQLYISLEKKHKVAE